MRSLLACSSGAKNQSNDADNRTHLYLNIYDLNPINNYLYWFGLGIFHTGIEVHGMEYAFGAHEYPTTGVFEVKPKSCPGFIYRRSVWMGSIDMSASDFRSFMEAIFGKYHGDTYNLITKNCNHFSNEVCMLLTGKSIPGWVNRLARLGSFCNCLVPEHIQDTGIRHVPDCPDYSDSDGSESAASSALAGSDGEDWEHHLLTTPNGDVAILREKSVKLVRKLA